MRQMNKILNASANPERVIAASTSEYDGMKKIVLESIRADELGPYEKPDEYMDDDDVVWELLKKHPTETIDAVTDNNSDLMTESDKNTKFWTNAVKNIPGVVSLITSKHPLMKHIKSK